MPSHLRILLNCFAIVVCAFILYNTWTCMNLTSYLFYYMLKLSINEITTHSGPFMHNKEKCRIFFLRLICYCFMCVLVHHEFSVLVQARREHQFVCNWSYRGLGAGVWVLGTEGGFCTKAVSTLNIWSILSAPCVFFLRKGWVKVSILL